MRILFIDDDQASHTYHGLMVEEAGIPKTSVQHFTLVDDAIEHLKSIIKNNNAEEWPTNIFTDINMPLKSGYDFVEEYVKLEHLFDDPFVIFVSSTRNQEDLEKITAFPIIKDIKIKFLEADYFKSLKEGDSN
jgi:CheY-like chemotaxis protein